MQHHGASARRIATAGALTLVLALAWTIQALAADQPIASKAPKGYRDYCDGSKRGQPSPCARGGAPASLWRQLNLPSVAQGEACPVSVPHVIATRVSPVLGSGPVYLAAGAYNPADRSTTTAPFPAPSTSVAFGTGWTLSKAPILMPKSLKQPLVLRGRRLDGVGDLGFSGYAGRRPFSALQFPASGYTMDVGTLKAHSVNLWFSAEGCYGIQIDGRTFSRVIVFRAAFRPQQ